MDKVIIAKIEFTYYPEDHEFLFEDMTEEQQLKYARELMMEDLTSDNLTDDWITVQFKEEQ